MGKYSLFSMPLILAGLAPTLLSADVVKFSCGSAPNDEKFCDWAVEAFEDATDGEHTAEYVTVPFQTEQQLQLLQQQFAAKSSDIDIILLDVIWPGLLGEHLLELDDYFTAEEIAEYTPGYIQNNTINGSLKAIPQFLDAGALYYRKDLLEKYGKEVPKTWDELHETAKFIQEEERKAGNEGMWGYVWQGKAYEGLTCDALEWLVSNDAGQVVEPDGTISVNNPNAIEILDKVASFVGDITPESVTSMTEEESRAVFQNGDAVFHRNWPYVWNLANDDDSVVRGKVAIAPLPHGKGKSAAALGGWSLAVNKYSKHPDLAVQLAKLMTSKEGQLTKYIMKGNNPTILSLYEEKELEPAKVFMEPFASAAARPSTPTGPRYNEVSRNFWNAVYSVISGEQEAKDALAKLEENLIEIKERSDDWTK